MDFAEGFFWQTMVCASLCMVGRLCLFNVVKCGLNIHTHTHIYIFLSPGSVALKSSASLLYYKSYYKIWRLNIRLGSTEVWPLKEPKALEIAVGKMLRVRPHHKMRHSNCNSSSLCQTTMVGTLTLKPYKKHTLPWSCMDTNIYVEEVMR